MRNLVVVSLATFALASSSAFAADMSMPLKAPPAPPPAVSWTGCYVDGGAGYGLWNQQHTTNTLFGGVPGTTISQTDGGRGWLGRVGGGCDYQTPLFNNRLVIGAFGQYDFMDLTGTNSPLEVTGTAPFAPISATEKEHGAWYAGARVGYLLAPSIMTYFDGGFTATRFDSQVETTNLGASIGFGYPAQTYDGWFLGGGTESSLAGLLGLQLPPSLFLRSEYRFSEYDTKTLNEIALPSGAPDGSSENTRPYVQTVTTELVWKFNWTGQ
jgi:outer membrane immunogenic protein